MSRFQKSWFDELGVRIAVAENHGAFILEKIADRALATTASGAITFALRHLGWVRTTVDGQYAQIEFDPLYVQTEGWAAAASYLAASGAHKFRIKSRGRGGLALWRSLGLTTQGVNANEQSSSLAHALEDGLRTGKVVDLTAYTSPSQYQIFDSSEAFQFAATLILIGLQQGFQMASFVSKRLLVEEITLPDMREIIIDWHYQQGQIHPEEWNRFWMSENLGSSIISTVGEDMEIRYAWIGDAVPLPSCQTRDSLKGRRILELAEPDYAARTWLHYEEVVTNKQPTFHEVELCLHRKVFKYTRLALPCFDVTGRVSHVISNSWVSNIYDMESDIETAL